MKMKNQKAKFGLNREKIELQGKKKQNNVLTCRKNLLQLKVDAALKQQQQMEILPELFPALPTSLYRNSILRRLDCQGNILKSF